MNLVCKISTLANELKTQDYEPLVEKQHSGN